MKFDYVIFDMDGLLVDSEQLAARVMSKMLARHGYTDISPDFFHSLLGKGSDETDAIIAAAFPGSDVSLDAITPEYLRRIDAGDMHLKPGALRLLDYLDQQGIHKCVASSNAGFIVQKTLASVGLSDRFDFVLHGDMVDFAKPAPDLFLTSAARWGVPPAQCLVLEDSYAGVQAAGAAGAPVIMVPDLVPPTDDIRALCLAVFDSLDDVLSFLQQS